METPYESANLLFLLSQIHEQFDRRSLEVFGFH